ncbi:MAG: hypothetical protein WCI17_01880 [bacterium]
MDCIDHGHHVGYAHRPNALHGHPAYTISRASTAGAWLGIGDQADLRGGHVATAEGILDFVMHMLDRAGLFAMPN